MPYQWNNLVQEWLLNQNLDYEPEEIVDAFNQVEKTMGSSWIGLTFGTTRGIWNAISIIELGKMLVDVEKTPNGSKLINKIKENSLIVFSKVLLVAKSVPRNSRLLTVCMNCLIHCKLRDLLLVIDAIPA